MEVKKVYLGGSSGHGRLELLISQKKKSGLLLNIPSLSLASWLVEPWGVLEFFLVPIKLNLQQGEGRRLGGCF